VAQGAALMTETHVQTRLLTAVAEFVPYDRLAATMDQVLRQVGPRATSITRAPGEIPRALVSNTYPFG
ncbi:hypothetical protein, partial [Marinovum sp. 1_MG-2023]|uniref:hypothetical protein n=1 Tax=Marinovum sp. 1_MG-2023 TaxID=3062633 RepID=UPI0026E1EAFE